METTVFVIFMASIRVNQTGYGAIITLSESDSEYIRKDKAIIF